MGWQAGFALAAWISVLLLPSRPWLTRERFEPVARDAGSMRDLSAVAVLIPARNEADSIRETLAALSCQGRRLHAVVVDDRSDDGTAAVVRQAAAGFDSASLTVDLVAGQALPDGWGGKLWALEQGLNRIEREYCLLLDADIELEPGVVAGLLDKAARERRAMVSVMAKLRCRTFWERLLVPPFIFFFKLLYPFANVNSSGRRTAAAAGGCVLLRLNVLRGLGGFSAMRDALIDDCTLAARVKRDGHAIWLGLSDSVRSGRAYPDLASFRHMVTRTAFTQLHYSALLLLLVCGLMWLMFAAPWLAIAAGPDLQTRMLGAMAVLAMACAFMPVVRFYGLAWPWALTLSAAGLLFAGMTAESALNYWRGTRARWKGRSYVVR